MCNEFDDLQLGTFEAVLENFAMHDVLVLVDQRAHAAGGPFVFIAHDVKSITAIGIDAGRQDHFVERVFLHGIDVAVNIELDG